MRPIDADVLMAMLGITDMDCDKCAWRDKEWNRCKRGGDFEDACCAIENAPTIEPVRMKGKWIYGENDCQDGWFCSECRFFIPWDYDYYGKDCDFIRDFKTCPYCDAKMVSYTGMRGEEDDT